MVVNAAFSKLAVSYQPSAISRDGSVGTAGSGIDALRLVGVN
jgi:hypothetical protein